VILCPTCGVRDEKGALRCGLVRSRARQKAFDRRVYLCRDCRRLWRAGTKRLVPVLKTLETTGEPTSEEVIGPRAPMRLGPPTSATFIPGRPALPEGGSDR
jgi:hypothetical protein